MAPRVHRSFAAKAPLDCITTLARLRRVRWRLRKSTKALSEGANVMLIIGCDFHPGIQQVAIFDKRKVEYQERALSRRAEAEQFYRALAGQALRGGREACGQDRWCARLRAQG